MPALILSRLLQAVPVLLAVGLIAFALFAFVGDPVAIMLGQDYSPAQRAELVHTLGLDRSVLMQYLHFLDDALHFRFGISFRLARPVADLIAERLPATVELALAASVLALALGVPLGVWTALRPRAWAARAVMGVSLVGVSLPTLLTGILLILCFSVWLRWLPSFGRGQVVQLGFWSTGLLTRSGLRALVLPSVTLGLFQMTLILRLVRAEMLETLGRDFIRFARARGLSARAVNLGHAFRNTLLPVITIAALQLGGIVAFSIVTETVFQWPGMGLLFVQSVASADIPVMSAYLMLVAVLFVTLNLVVDILYYLLDPRLRASGAG